MNDATIDTLMQESFYHLHEYDDRIHNIVSGMSDGIINLRAEIMRLRAALTASQVQTAAAFEAAAKIVDEQHQIHMTSKGRDPAKYISSWSCTADEIRALTPPDAHAAMQAMIDAAVKEAWVVVAGPTVYTGEINPGMEFIWEKDNPKAMQLVLVTRITSHENDERRIWTKSKEGEFWNDESRFREAVTLDKIGGDLVYGMLIAWEDGKRKYAAHLADQDEIARVKAEKEEWKAMP